MEQIEMTHIQSDTIAAISTPAGNGGIAIIRISGPEAIKIVSDAWKGADLSHAKSHTAHFGEYHDISGQLLDQSVATVFRAPKSFTGEDTIELSIHGSRWLQRNILSDLIRRGIRMAAPGEFTQRAFLNNKLDLAQAEGVADLIACSSRASQSLAMAQMKGSFSSRLSQLRDKLVEFASLLELELDFSEEDVEFVDRNELKNLASFILDEIGKLAHSYSIGAVLKSGVNVVIAGVPNAGKSSLLNLLLDEDKAIISNIPGTTRDIIEDCIELEGILFRFIDTAGLHETQDVVEKIGISKTCNSIKNANIIIWVIDSSEEPESQINQLSETISSIEKQDKSIIILKNKSDIKDLEFDESINDELKKILKGFKHNSEISFSTTSGQGLPILIDTLVKFTDHNQDNESDVIVTNERHYESLLKGKESLQRAIEGLETGLPSDLIAQDVREAISHIGEITGSISSLDLLHNIFSRFFIGK